MVTARHFEDDGETPNHPHLPLFLFRGTAAASDADPASWFEDHFITHGWGSVWRWGIYPFHHFHSNNHEVLGVSRGSARLMLGGKHGSEFQVTVAMCCSFQRASATAVWRHRRIIKSWVPIRVEKSRI